MAAFEYLALNPNGRKRNGVIEGDTARQARQKLRARGLMPLSVNTIGEARGSRLSRFGFSSRMGAAELALVTRQLAILVQSGLPLDEALGTVSAQTEQRHTKRVLLAVRAKVVTGHSLAAGLADFPGIFSEMFRATVAAGEQSGHLDLVLDRLADYTEQRMRMRHKIQLALLYPGILTLMAITVTVGLMTYVVPDVIRVFQDTGQTLPIITRTLIDISGFLGVYGAYLLPAFLCMPLLFRLLLRVPGIRLAFHRLLLALPLTRRLLRGLNTALFTRTLSILTASGVPVLESLRISGQVLTLLPMRRAVETAAHRVREGASLYNSLSRDDYFPPLALQLIASGESSGNLDAMLSRAASQQEHEAETTIGAVLGLFEPLLILIMGLLVLVIVLAVLLPIFDLNQLIR